MGVGEPLGTGVVELGEGAVFQVSLGGVGRVEPCVAQADEFACGVGDGADDGGVGFGGLGAGRLGEREGLETWWRNCSEGPVFERGAVAEETTDCVRHRDADPKSSRRRVR